MIDVSTDWPPSPAPGLRVVGPVDVAPLRMLLDELVARVEAEGVFVGEAPELWGEFDRIGRLADSAKVLLAGKVEESEVWRRAGDRDAATYMARQSGCSIGLARRALTTSARLILFPRTRQAVVRGELSAAQAEAIADAASKNPAAEAHLVDSAATMSLAELRWECLRAKATGDPDPDEKHRRIHSERHLRTHTDAEGAWCLQARGTAADGALINLALEPIISDLFNQTRNDDQLVRRETLAFDALVELSRRELADDDRPAGATSHDTVGCDRHPDPGNDASPDGHRGEAGDNDGADQQPTSGHDLGSRRGGANPDDCGAASRMHETGADSDSAGTGAPHGEAPASDPADMTQGHPPPPNRPQRRRRNRKFRGAATPNYTALLRLDLSALVRGHPVDGELCEIAGIGPVPVT